jgi:23S rRNA pseudouridine955/2504/2580 synthase
VIFAKNYESLKNMNRLMRERKIKKLYLGVVHGALENPVEIKGYLEKDSGKNRSVFREKETPEGKWVHSSVRPLKTGRAYTLVEIELHTGRSHQIRASLGAIGHPLVGDGKYGGRPHPEITHYLLHAYHTEVETMVFEAESEAINAFCEKEIR